MAQLPKFDPIEFLVSQRFPVQRTIQNEPIWVNRSHRKSPTAIKYARELRAKPKVEIDALVATERAKVIQEKEARAAAEESARVFNRLDSSADYSHWCKAAYWKLDEAIALSFGKAPEKVCWECVKVHLNASQFAFEYEHRRVLVLRAKGMGQLSDPVLPGFFVAWAKRTGIGVPNGLVEAIVGQGHHVADWRTLLDVEKAAHAATKKWASARIEEGLNTGRNTIAEQDKLIARLQAEIAEVKANSGSIPKSKAYTASESLGLRERESLLKMIIGMAVKGYGFDPKSTRSGIAAEIASDLLIQGVGLDEDTVRKYLKAACGQLPRGETE